MNRSTQTASRPMPRLALAVTTAIAGLAMAGGISIAANAAPRADQSFASAQAALSKGQVAKAIAHAEAAVMADPRNPGYRALLGAAYLEAGRFQAAATSFGDAIDLGDDNARTILSFALAKVAMGDSRSALDVLEDNAQSIDSADLGLALALAGQPERGVHVLINAVRSADTVTPKLRQNLAYAYALSGNWRAARVMAAEDVPADQLDARLSHWAAMTAPEMYQQRIASLIDVSPRTDEGQPMQLALANFPADNAMAAEAFAQSPVEPAAEMAFAEAAPEPAAAPALVPATAPVTNFAQAFASPEAAPQPTLAPGTGIRFVSNPMVQALPVSTAGAPTRFVPTPTRMAAAVAPTKARPQAPRISDQAAATHLVQLGSYDSKIEAERGWNALKSKFPQLKDHKPVITQALVNGRTFWRVAANGFGPKSAKAMCGSVKSAGRGCFAYAATTPPAGAVKRDVQMASRSR